jgi:hypothetical protein
VTATLAPTTVRGTSWTTWAVVLLLPVGPAAIAVLRLVLPYYTASDTSAMVAAVEAHPARQSAVIWLTYIGVLTLVPGVIAAARVCQRGAPRLTAWALALSVPGYLSMGTFAASDHLLWSAHDAGLSGSDSVALARAAHPSVDVALGVFVVGHVVGTVLLGLALWRSRGVPAWAAWAVAVSQPLHFTATVVLGSPQVDFVAWNLMAVGMVLVGRELLRTAPSR